MLRRFSKKSFVKLQCMRRLESGKVSHPVLFIISSIWRLNPHLAAWVFTKTRVKRVKTLEHFSYHERLQWSEALRLKANQRKQVFNSTKTHADYWKSSKNRVHKTRVAPLGPNQHRTKLSFRNLQLQPPTKDILKCVSITRGERGVNRTRQREKPVRGEEREISRGKTLNYCKERLSCVSVKDQYSYEERGEGSFSSIKERERSSISVGAAWHRFPAPLYPRTPSLTAR